MVSEYSPWDFDLLASIIISLLKMFQPPAELRGYFSDSDRPFSQQYVKEVNQRMSVGTNGPLNITFPLHKRVGKKIKLQLVYSSKWILLSEVSFETGPVYGNFSRPEEKGGDQDILFEKENKEKNNSIVIFPDTRQDMPSREQQDKLETEDKNRTHRQIDILAQTSDTSQTYVGIVIGVLSVTVMLLLTTIILILRNNRHKIFSKHSS